MGMHNSALVLHESTTMAKLLETLNESIVYKKTLIISRDKGNVKELEIASKGKAMAFEAKQMGQEKDIEALKEAIFGLLNKILVYTKRPGGEVEYTQPLVLRQGATVEDAAKLLHKEFAANLKFARVWGSTKFQGMRVQKTYKLQNKDVIEINA